MDRHLCRHSWSQPALQRMPRIQRNLHWYSLHDLGEIPRSVVGRQKRKLRTAGRRDLFYLPMQHDPWKGVDLDFGCISLSDVSNLRLQVIGLDPRVAFDQVDHLHTRCDQLPFLHMALADRAVSGCRDPRISEIYL